MSYYGQLVIGAPGAGKSTYCAGLLEILRQLKRPVVSINLDPANDVLPFKADIDIRELITVEDAMEKLSLGPNGALRYCIRLLRKNINWLKSRLEKYPKAYVVIDMPGQLELYNSDTSITEIIDQFRRWDWRFCAVHLSDSLYASDPGKFIAVVLSALAVMVNLEVAQVNVLSKMDLLPSDTPFNQDFFEQLPDMRQMARLMNDHVPLQKYKKLSESICDVIEDYNLVNFVPLNVFSKSSMLTLLKMADTANGFYMVNVTDLRDVVLKE